MAMGRNTHPMAIELRKEISQDLVRSIQRYFREQHDVELSDLRARLLLDFVVAEVGPSIYNRAIQDAQRYFQDRTQDLDGSCYEPEMPFWKAKAKRSALGKP